MRRVSFAEMDCPVARSLDVIGEWWTLLIVRDAIRGARRFEDFKSTGIADNILSTRLKRLVADGVFERMLYQQHPDRYEYVLTDKGRALGLVVGALRAWGKEWTRGRDVSPRVVHEACDHEVLVRRYCEECGRPPRGPRDPGHGGHPDRRVALASLFLIDAIPATARLRSSSRRAVFVVIRGAERAFHVGRALSVGRQEALPTVAGNTIGEALLVGLVAIGLGAVFFRVRLPLRRKSASPGSQ